LIALGVGLFTGFLLGRWDPLFAWAFWIFYLFAAFFLPLGTGRFTKSAAESHVTQRGELEGALIEYLSGLADLLIYDRSKSWQARIQLLSQSCERSLARLTRISSLFEALLNLTQNLALAGILLIAIPAVVAGELEPVLLAVVLLITYASYEAVLPLPAGSRQWSSSMQAASRLFEVIDAEPDVVDPDQPIPIGEPTSLQTQELEFYYPQQPDPALRNASFKLQKGRQVGIAGRSGAGKSTLANLLLRFWDYRKGSVLLNTIELKDILQQDVRKSFAVVEQDGYLFEGTIRENLRLANPSANDHTIRTALQNAEALSFINSMPEGLNTWIGEHGFGLSGGEAQRLRIARALLQDRSALILDEPTADIDPLTANQILRALQSRKEQRLTIWITHRFVGLEFLDEILVLEQGELAERGGFSDLLSQKGSFYMHWGKQLDASLIDLMPSKVSQANR
jgi:ATP-binding cassette subfamily C protein CydC